MSMRLKLMCHTRAKVMPAPHGAWGNDNLEGKAIRFDSLQKSFVLLFEDPVKYNFWLENLQLCIQESRNRRVAIGASLSPKLPELSAKLSSLRLPQLQFQRVEVEARAGNGFNQKCQIPVAPVCSLCDSYGLLG